MDGHEAFRIALPAEQEDVATAELWEAGTSGIEQRGEGGGRLALVAYFPAGRVTAEELAVRLPGAEITPAEVPAVDWVARFRESFRGGTAAGFRLVPRWEWAEERPVPADVLLVDPGRAFGTGTHETTRLCLGALRRLSATKPGLGRVLDVGTGTGLLGLAALRLGARCVVASDLDADAVESARGHARINGAPELRLLRADGAAPFQSGAFDLVVANLSAPLLATRGAELTTAARGGGRLVLAGLLAGDADEVQAAFPGTRRLAREDDGDWACLVLERTAP
jgi:ribosomal protein L11 methyltransferase